MNAKTSEDFHVFHSRRLFQWKPTEMQLIPKDYNKLFVWTRRFFQAARREILISKISGWENSHD